MKEKKEFLNYIHLFRGLAIVVIVGIHCRISLPWSENYQFSKAIFTALLDNGTVLFVFIAGFLFQYLRPKYRFSSYFQRKLKFVILPYILVSIPVLLYKYFDETQVYPWMPDFLVDQAFYAKSAYMLFTGKHLGPFWFIPMIFLFYLISPVLVKIDNKVFYLYVFPVLFIFGLFTFRFGYYSTTIDSFLHYFPIYIFGMWASAYKKQLTQVKMVWIWLLLAIYIIIAYLEINQFVQIPKLTSFKSTDTLPYFHFNFAKLKVSLLCIILIRVFYQFNDNEAPALKRLANDSFGIYFLHLYIITAVEISLNQFAPNFKLGFFSFLVYIIFVTLTSMLLIEVVKRIAGKKSRMLIGC